MIELKNVTKMFGNKTAVDNISFKVDRGEIVGFLGPNGAGKTTSMRMITGFFPPTHGTVKVADFDMSVDFLKAKEKIGYMPENVPLYKELTVTEYLRFIAEIKGVPKAWVKERAKKAMDEAAVTEVKDRVIGKLSKGFRQRVGLAQAILNDPEVLVLDEPTVGLDPRQIKDIRSLIKNMKGKRTIILSTHILSEVTMACDRVIIINKGKLAAQDDLKSLAETYKKSKKLYVEVDAARAVFAAEIKKVKGVKDIHETDKAENGMHGYEVEIAEGREVNRDIAEKIVKNDWTLGQLKPVEMTLEDIYMKIITKEEN